MKIIDCHCHLGRYFNFHVPGHSPEDMIVSMDNADIAVSCICPHMNLSSDPLVGNKFMLDTVTSYPERFIGLFTYNPHHEDLMKKMIPDHFMNPSVRGIKIHQGSHGTNLMNPGYRYIYEFASKYRLPILIHSWALDTIKEIEILSIEYPDAVFIMGHTGAIPVNMKYAAGVLRARNNVYGDTSVSMMYERNIEWLTEIAGADSIMFGSDSPFYDPRPTLGRILLAGIDEKDKEKILGRNMADILDNIKPYENT